MQTFNATDGNGSYYNETYTELEVRLNSRNPQGSQNFTQRLHKQLEFCVAPHIRAHWHARLEGEWEPGSQFCAGIECVLLLLAR